MPRTLSADIISGTQKASVQQSSIIDSSATTPQYNGVDTYGQPMTHTTQPSLAPKESSYNISDPTFLDFRLDTSGSNGQSFSALQFTPSDDDFTFQNMLDWGWESLDTIGKKGWHWSHHLADLVDRVPSKHWHL
jgi:hypothetical protein